MKTLEKLSPIIILTLALVVIGMLQERYLTSEAGEPMVRCTPEEREYVAEYGYA